MSDPLLDDTHKSQAKGNEIFARIKRERVMAAIREREERKWNGKVLYPSGLHWSMCVADHVYETLPKGGWIDDDPESLERMALGTARHEDWGAVLDQSVNFLLEPKYPQQVLNEIDRKAKDGKPVKPYEVYVFAPLGEGEGMWGISGYIDLCYKFKKRYKLADFKTKNFDPMEWENFLKGEESNIELPTNKELTQIYVYYVITTFWNYWDGVDIEELRLAYYNNPSFSQSFKEGDAMKACTPEWEWFQEPDPSRVKMTRQLLDEGQNQLLRYNSGHPKECKYELCNKHSGTGRVSRSKDPLS